MNELVLPGFAAGGNPPAALADAFVGAQVRGRTISGIESICTHVARIVKCPQCKADVPWTPESKWRPFCSQRCRMIDLGAWASERYRVETHETPGAIDGGDEEK